MSTFFKPYFLSLSSIIFSVVILGQGVLTNDGSIIHSELGAIIYVDGGDILNENNGVFDNSGDIYLDENWINNAGNNAFINSSSGTVTMYGGNQYIMGLDKTRFYNLVLDGGAVIKEMFVNAEVENNLDLIDAELQTHDNIMFVTNTNPNAILWNLGFVSGDSLGGYLARTTNSTNAYLFPVGSRSIPNTYRAVSISPLNTDSNQFAVRLAHVDATFDNTGVSFTGAIGGFDRSVKSPNVENINSLFYHNIAHFMGNTNSDVDIYYFNSDGQYSGVAQWKNDNKWYDSWDDNVSVLSLPVIGSPDNKASVKNYNDFTHDVFALANIKVAKVDIPQFISPNGDNKNDALIIPGIEKLPNNTLRIFNRWGVVVYEMKGYNNSWKGTSNKKLQMGSNSEYLPSGTYFYTLDLGNGQEGQTGYVHIQR